jgi:hypothetical protein
VNVPVTITTQKIEGYCDIETGVCVVETEQADTASGT